MKSVIPVVFTAGQKQGALLQASIILAEQFENVTADRSLAAGWFFVVGITRSHPSAIYLFRPRKHQLAAAVLNTRGAHSVLTLHGLSLKNLQADL